MCNKIKCICGNVKHKKFVSPNGVLIDIYGKGQHAKINAIQCSECGVIRQTNLPFSNDQEYYNYYKNSYPPVNSDYREKTYLHDKQLASLRCNEYGIKGGSKERLLDVGSGSGAFVDECRERGVEAYGCEILEYYYQKKDNYIYRDRLENIGFPTDYFDWVTCHDIIEHVLNPLRLIKELFRITKQDGKCVIDFPRFYHAKGKHHWKKIEHVWFFTTEQLEKILKKEGFVIDKIIHPIESKTVFYITKPQQKRPFILLPPGLGDSFWSVVKLESFLKQKKLGLPDIGIVSPRDKVYEGHKRAFPFLEMFPILKSTGRVICGNKNPNLKRIWREAYAREGRIVFEGLLGADYFISYNGHLSVGKSLDQIDTLKCNWYPKMFISLAQKNYERECKKKYKRYIAYYFPYYGTYKYWVDEFPISKYIETINNITFRTGCVPVFVGAQWDAVQKEYQQIKKEVDGCIDLMGNTSADQLYGLIRGSQAMIGHPSGLTVMATVLGTKTLILWNDYYNRDFVWNSCPPDTKYKTYFAENTKELTVERLSSISENIIDGKFIENRELPSRINPSKVRKNGDTASKFIKMPRKTLLPSKQVDITIACVLKSGGDYTIDYVKRLKSMLERHTTIPYKFVCITDIDIDKDICNSIKFSQDYGGWWSKIELFREGVINSERAIYFDLDTVILNNIDDLLRMNYEFLALKPWNKKNQISGLCASGMMAWKNNGSFSFIYNEFNKQSIPKYPKGDQEYISKILMKNNKKPIYFQDLVNGIYSYKRNCRNFLPNDAKVICFHGRPRPHEMKEKWVLKNWK